MSSNCVRHSGASMTYTSTRVGGKTVKLHRVVYAAHRGVSLESMAGLVVMHTCDNRWCINPDHLVLGTQSENLQDMERKGRGNHPAGSRAGRSKLTEEQIVEIKSLARRMTHRQLAEKFGVDHSTIGRVLRNQSYKN